MDGAPLGAIIGKAMSQFKGKVDGKELTQLIQSFM